MAFKAFVIVINVAVRRGLLWLELLSYDNHYVNIMRRIREIVGERDGGKGSGVCSFLKWTHKTWSSGATVFWVWRSNCNVKVWKSPSICEYTWNFSKTGAPLVPLVIIACTLETLKILTKTFQLSFLNVQFNWKLHIEISSTFQLQCLSFLWGGWGYE